MPKPVTSHPVLLSPEELCAETLRKFGIGGFSDNKISEKAVSVIACFAGACLPVIGEHCRSAVRLHEDKLTIAAERNCENLETENGDPFSKTAEDLHRKHKRLVAQKAVDRSVAAACQYSTHLLNRGGNVLQKTAPLLPVPQILSDRLESLNQIHAPKLVRPERNSSCVPSLIEVASHLDEVAKYSVLRFLQTRVFDHCDGERSIEVLSKAIATVKNDLERLRSTPQDARLGKYITIISAHVRGLKKLASEVQNICVDRENAEQFLNILTRMNGKLNELPLHGETDLHQMQTIENLQESVDKIMAKLGDEIASAEAMEDEIRSAFREICSSREIIFERKVIGNLMRQFQRNPYHMAQTVMPVCTPPGNTLLPFNETSLDDELETRMERLEIDPRENVSALEYLASLEFGVDASKIHSTILIPPGNIEEVVTELKNFEIISFAN